MTRRTLIIGGVIIVIAVVGVFAWQKNRTPFVPVDGDQFLKTSPSEKEITRYLKNMEEAYAKDTYGGDTPEETLNLFIDALKQGDTDLAAKYFIVEKQTQMGEELKRGVQSGGVQSFLNSVAVTKDGYSLLENRYRFEIPNIKNDGRFLLELILNPLTKKWKIESL